MISDKLEQAKINPEKDYHLKMDIRRVLNLAESDDDYSEAIESELEELEEDNPIHRLIESINIWEESGGENFEDGINSAIDALDDLYDLSRDEDWNSVASFSLLKSIEYQEELGGFDPSSKFEEVLDFLETEFYQERDVHLGQFGDHTQKMLERLDDMDDENIEFLLKLVDDRATQLKAEKNFMNEREYLNHKMEIKRCLNQDISDAESRMVESFEDEFEMKSSAASHIKADILERAVAECQLYLSDEKENEWRLEIRELNRKAQDEMPRMGHEVDVGDDVDRIIDYFKQERSESSSWEALASLLYAPVGQGNFEATLEMVDEAPLTNMLSRSITSPEGDSVGFEPGFGQEGERAPSGYLAGIQVSNHILAVAIFRLIDEGMLSEVDFYMVLSLIPGISIQDEAFLIDAVINLFEENYAEAVHLAVPRLESVTANAYEEVGMAVTKNQGKVYRQRGLGGLFGLIEEDISTDFGKYLQYQYTDTAGQNIRNRVAHGQIKYSATNFKLASTLIFDIFRTGARITDAYS